MSTSVAWLLPEMHSRVAKDRTVRPSIIPAAPAYGKKGHTSESPGRTVCQQAQPKAKRGTYLAPAGEYLLCHRFNTDRFTELHVPVRGAYYHTKADLVASRV